MVESCTEWGLLIVMGDLNSVSLWKLCRGFLGLPVCVCARSCVCALSQKMILAFTARKLGLQGDLPWLRQSESRFQETTPQRWCPAGSNQRAQLPILISKYCSLQKKALGLIGEMAALSRTGNGQGEPGSSCANVLLTKYTNQQSMPGF